MPTNTLQPDHIKLIDVSEENTLFFHTRTLQIYPIHDQDILSFLKTYQEKGYYQTKKEYPAEDFHELYDFICKTIKKAPQLTNMEYPDLQTENFNTVILPISAGCNLNCPYCFAQTDGGFHFGDFTANDLDRIVSFIIQKQSDKESPLTLIFFGGEPLLNVPLIKHTLALFKEKYSDYNVRFSITTNGTLLNDEIIRMFKEHNFAVLVSLDGYDNEFNLRRFKNGKSSVGTVVKNIGRLKENGIFTEIRATLVNSNPFIVETIHFLEEQEVPYSAIFAYTSENKSHHLADYDADSLASIRSQLDNLLAYYIDRVKKNEPIRNKMFGEVLPVLRFRVNKKIPCGAGVGFFTVTANGDIYSCAHLMNESRYKIGTVASGITDKSGYIPVAIDKIEECKACWARYLCLGGCPSQKISMGGRNDSKKGEFECELERLMWIFYIRLYYHLMNLAPGYLKESE